MVIHIQNQVCNAIAIFCFFEILLYIFTWLRLTEYITDAIARETKSFSFQAIGLLAQRLPQLFRCFTYLLCFVQVSSTSLWWSDLKLILYHLRDKIEMAVRLFDALKVESPYLRLVIQEATSALATAYKVL